MGKGINRIKTDSVNLSNVKNDWFREYFKFAGIIDSGIIKYLKVGKSYDIKCYVPDLKELDYHLFVRLNQKFCKVMKTEGTHNSVKFDDISLLRYCFLFIELKKEKNEEDSILLLESPKMNINGFYTAYFKDMGQNKSITNISYLELPDFVKIENDNDYEIWLNILQEHIDNIRSIEEKESGTGELLQKYREFITRSSIDILFDFLSSYSVYLLQRISKNKFYKYFDLKNMEVLIEKMSKQYSNIIQNEGVKNIATAIRRATLTASFNKGKKERLQYPVHYGMAQELKLKSLQKDSLIVYLSQFIAEYNTENMRMRERKPDDNYLRKDVSDSDIAELVKLIDEYSSEIVGNLIAAIGFSYSKN
jgi:gluconate kinase